MDEWYSYLIENVNPDDNFEMLVSIALSGCLAFIMVMYFVIRYLPTIGS